MLELHTSTQHMGNGDEQVFKKECKPGIKAPFDVDRPNSTKRRDHPTNQTLLYSEGELGEGAPEV
jgi:hypothetical protein